VSNVLGTECCWPQSILSELLPQAVPVPAFVSDAAAAAPADPPEVARADLLPFASAEWPFRRQALLEAFLACCRQRLREAWESESQGPVRAALEERTVADLADLPIGLVADLAVLRNSLVDRGFSHPEIKDAKLLTDDRLPGRICGPICDARGRIVSRWAGDPRPCRPRYLYLMRDWNRQVPVAGLDTALGWAARNGDLVLVEDILDGVVLRARGFPHVAAIGGAAQELSEARWEHLAALGIPRVILALDHARTHPGGILAALASARRAETAPEVFVVPTYRFAPHFGPIGVLRHRGPETLAAILQHGQVPARRYWAQSVHLPLLPYHLTLSDEPAAVPDVPEEVPAAKAARPLRRGTQWCEFPQCPPPVCVCCA